MEPIELNPSRRHDLNADLATLARALREPHLSDRDRLRIVGSVVACIRVRHLHGAYGLARRGRDSDFARELSLPNPN